MASTFILHIVNTIHMILGGALTAASIWFFIEIQAITNLRNTNRHLLEHNVYWPQALPWVFVFVGILILLVSCCGCIGAKKKSRGIMVTYLIFECIAIAALVAATSVALIYADSERSDSFIKDIMLDVKNYMQRDLKLEEAFHDVEKRFQCCGVYAPRDYISWKKEFPISCCENYNNCNINNDLVNERHGCSIVIMDQTRFCIRVLAGASAFTAFVGLITVIIAVVLLIGSLKKKKSQMILASHELESKKALP